MCFLIVRDIARMGCSKSKIVTMLVLVLIILGGGRSSEGCLEHEKFDLLRLKHFFNSLYTLQNWVGEQRERVECSNSTCQVVQLHLGLTRNIDLGEWYLNASLFTSFQQLGNKIAGCMR